MDTQDLLRYIVRGTRGTTGALRSKTTAGRKPRAKTARKPKGKGCMGGAKSGYMAHVKKYSMAHPNTPWRDCMIKARASYKPKAGAMAGARAAGVKRRKAGARAAGKPNLRKAATKVNKGLRDTKAISRTLKALAMIPTPLSGVANDVGAVANVLGYGRRRARR